MNVTTMTWLRRLAVAESHALRALYRAHGYVPACRPLDPESGNK